MLKITLDPRLLALGYRLVVDDAGDTTEHTTPYVIAGKRARYRLWRNALHDDLFFAVGSAGSVARVAGHTLFVLRNGTFTGA